MFDHRVELEGPARKRKALQRSKMLHKGVARKRTKDYQKKEQVQEKEKRITHPRDAGVNHYNLILFKRHEQEKKGGRARKESQMSRPKHQRQTSGAR